MSSKPSAEVLADFQSEYLKMFRESFVPASVRVDRGNGVGRQIFPSESDHPSNYCIACEATPAGDLSAMVGEEIEAMKRNGHRWGWWKLHDYPVGQERLIEPMLAQGFKWYRESRMMFLPVTSKVKMPAGIVLKKMTPTDSSDPIRDISLSVWKKYEHDWGSALIKEMSGPNPQTEVFLSRVAGEAEWASMGWVRYYHRVGFLFGGSTVEKFRGRGAYQALVAARLDAARLAGMKYLVSECTKDSERVLSGLGFLDAGKAMVYQLDLRDRS